MDYNYILSNIYIFNISKRIIISFKYIIFIIIIYLLFKSNYSYINIQNINSNNSLTIINDINNHVPLYSYIKYIKYCKSLKRNNNQFKKENEYPFLSICMSVYNIERYIEMSLLSVLNQSFKDFEIIIINDFSKDNTLNIINKLQLKDNRIKIINHEKNLGTYHSRAEAVLNSKGKYILFLDPDDMILNPNLFEILFIYNLNLNLDIIEFTVYHTIENKKKIFYPEGHIYNHNHQFTKKIIKQPELSNTLFIIPQTNNYTYVFCRTLWNKLYKREVILNSIKYIGEDYYQKYYIIVVEDTLLNIINFQFANNYTNINLPGYLYNIRESSISHIKGNSNHVIIESISFYLYFKLFLKYIKEFDKNRNFFYFEFKDFSYYFKNFKQYNVKEYLQKTIYMLYDIINDNKTTIELKNFTNNLLLELNN